MNSTLRASFHYHRRHWLALVGLLLGYLIIFAMYYPPSQGIEDEVGYINQALVWSKGAVSAEGAGYGSLYGFVELGGWHIPWRNPGRSLLILPLLMVFGVKSIFVSGALIHAALTVAAAATLVTLNVSPLYASLVLFHPTLAIYSRTIMGDSPAALFLLLALLGYCAARRPGLWCGLAVGLAAVMRYQTGLVLPFLALALWWHPKLSEPRREALNCLLAGGLCGLSLVAYNFRMFGNASGAVNGGANQGYFDFTFAATNGAFYLTAMLLIWPGMLLALWFDQSFARWAIAAIALPILCLLLPYYWFDQGASWAQTLIVGQRLLQPALPVWIVAYAWCLDQRVWPRFRMQFPASAPRYLAAAFCLVCLVAQAIIFRKHDQHLAHLVAVRNWMGARIPGGALVIGNSTLRRTFGVPAPDIPLYRWKSYDYFGKPFDHTAQLAAERRDWFLATLAKTPVAEPPAVFATYIGQYKLVRLESPYPDLLLYRTCTE